MNFYQQQQTQSQRNLITLYTGESDCERPREDSCSYLDARYTLNSTNESNKAIDDHQASRLRLIFPIATDALQDDKATEIKLLSFQRPHMRAFHYAWISFFVAFFGWFSIPPLMPTIKRQLNLTEDQIYNSNIASVSSTIIGRVIVGPMCDRYGSRTVQSVLLVMGAIPVASAAFAIDYWGFMLVRFFIGLIGCSFVATANWTSVMFSKEVVGSANALAAGWGNLGAGVTYLITPVLFDLVTYGDTISSDMGWRITLLFPAVLMVVIGVLMYYYSDDCPHGNYVDMKKNQISGVQTFKPKTDMKRGLIAVCKQPATWILAFHYACCFGVEIQVHNVLSLYYFEDFRSENCDPLVDSNKCRLLTQTKAGLISSMFGLMCIFARAVGGYASDLANRRSGMKGRIIMQFGMLLGEAIFLYLYSQIKTLAWSIPCLVIFGIFAQASTGTSYAIVPYISQKYTGATSGVVGAGGNLGALCWGILFKAVGNRTKSFEYLSYFVAVAAAATAGVYVEGERSLWG